MSEKNIFITVVFVLLSLSVFVLLDYSSNPAGSESLATIIDEETAPPPASVQTKLEALKDYMAPVVNQIPADTTFMLSDLATGETLVVGDRQDFVAASLYKLFIAYYAYEQIDAGKITLETVLSNNLTLDGCLDLMITISDNECGVLLGDLFGWANIDTKIHAEGFTDTTLSPRNSPGGDIRTSPNDIHSFFTRLYNNELMSENHTEHLLNLLLNQKVNNRLPPILPEGIVVAHKTGDVYSYIHDAGIVFSEDGDYVFVIMSAKWAEDMTFGPGYAYFQEMFSMIFSGIR